MNVERIQKLIRLLSSSNDGEALAAVRALQRVLREGGSDVHELAARIAGLTDAEMKKLYDAGFREGRREGQTAAAAARPDFSDVGPTPYQMACEVKHKGAGRLMPKEAGFVEDMVRWCARREPSEKQLKWLHSIYCRVSRR